MSDPVPLVSVVIPVYNAARYLHAAVTSIQAQTFSDFEIIAINDGSTDSSKTILEQLARADPRLRIISRPNTGIVGALNDGLAVARGKFIARMDADDIAEPARFEAQVIRLRADAGLVALGSAVTFIDANGNRVKPCARPLEHAAIERDLLSGDGGAMIHPAVMFRAESVHAVGGYRRETQFVEDLDLFLRLARIGQLANLSASLLRYRVHPTSINFTKNAGRHLLKIEVLRAAYEARNLPFKPENFPNDILLQADPAAHYRDWAVTSLAFGQRSVAIGHGWRAVRLRPRDAASWRALRYALTAPMPRG